MIDTRNPDYTELPVRAHGAPRALRRGTAAPTISVLTPYFNTEQFFFETVASVLGQSFADWEWVIVDDGSTDAAAVDRLRQAASRDPRIRVFRQQNAGPAAARNRAFAESRGRFVCLLDSDDLIEPTYLETCAWFLESHPEFAFCNSWSVVFGDERYLWTTGFETGKAHVRANSGPPISVVRREAYERGGGFDESIRYGHEDWDFWLRLARAGHWGYTIRDFQQWYRKRGSGRFGQFMKDAEAHARFEAFVRERYHGLEESFPAPVRRYRQPYETTNFEVPFDAPDDAGDGEPVLFLVPWMVTGGADRVNLDLVEALRKSGARVTICAFLPADHVWKHRFSQLTPDIFVLPDFLHASDYPRFLAWILTSRRCSTIVVSGAVLSYQLLPYLRSVAPQATVVDVCHVEEPAWLNGGYPRLSVGYRDLIDLTITTTGHLKRWMLARGASDEGVEVMYTGVAARDDGELASARSAVRHEYSIADSTLVVCFVGRICAQKRPDLLARILAEVAATGQDIRAFVIGDGELAGNLDETIKPLVAGGRVVRLGSVSHERWLSIVAASDVFLLPSEYEGISVALLEAMSAGAVPIVSRVGGQDEVVRQGAGFLVEHAPDEVTKYVELVLRLARSRDELVRMQSAARAAISTNLSTRATQARFVELLRAAAGASRQRAFVPASLGRELATQALEANRLSEAVDWLWSRRDGSPTSELLPQGMAIRLALALSGSRLGRWLRARSTVKRLVARVLGRLERRPRGSSLQNSAQ
jgi:glycosyltransferase involved in cell wall biosynthesis/GT2 family glycosyltransferase